MSQNKKAPAVDGKGDVLDSDPIVNSAEMYKALTGELRKIGVTMVTGDYVRKMKKKGHAFFVRMYRDTEYGAYFDVTDLKLENLPAFDLAVAAFGFDGEGINIEGILSGARTGKLYADGTGNFHVDEAGRLYVDGRKDFHVDTAGELYRKWAGGRL